MSEVWVIESRKRDKAIVGEWFVCNWFKTEVEARERISKMNKDWPDHDRRVVKRAQSPEVIR